VVDACSAIVKVLDIRFRGRPACFFMAGLSYLKFVKNLYQAKIRFMGSPVTCIRTVQFEPLTGNSYAVRVTIESTFFATPIITLSSHDCRPLSKGSSNYFCHRRFPYTSHCLSLPFPPCPMLSYSQPSRSGCSDRRLASVAASEAIKHRCALHESAPTRRFKNVST
jgi:hypothetical protein